MESTEPIPDSISRKKQKKNKKSEKTDTGIDNSLKPLPKAPQATVYTDKRRIETKSNSKKITNHQVSVELQFGTCLCR